METTTTNLFFSGGWDSTFRFLQLLLVEKRPVKPVYLVDLTRRSVAQELKVQAAIKKAVIERDPAAAELLLPTLIFNITDLKPDPVLKQSEQEALKQFFFGSQYEWLARAVVQLDLPDAELCIVNSMDFHAHGTYTQLLPYLTPADNGGMRFDDKYAGQPMHTLFGKFTYPIISLTKADLGELAREHGFLDILELSWFCHTPNIFGEPCGMCNPCVDAMTMNMSHRLPPFSRFCHYANPRLAKQTFLNKFPGLHMSLRKLKRKLKG